MVTFFLFKITFVDYTRLNVILYSLIHHYFLRCWNFFSNAVLFFVGDPSFLVGHS